MSEVPPDKELQEFFEEVWQLAELAAESEDWRLAPHLFALAQDVAWGDQPEADALDLSVAGPDPQPGDARQAFRSESTLQDHDADSGSARLDIMAERLLRQRSVISRMECIGGRQAIEHAYQLFQAMQDSIDIVLHSRAIVLRSRAMRAVAENLINPAVA